MTQLNTHGSLCGRPINARFGPGIGNQQEMVDVLDDAVPLHGVSHADVVEYAVETPMRYAECFALLEDGRKVRLQDPGAFVGWSRHGRSRSLLFCSNGRHYEVAVEADLRGRAPGCIRSVFRETPSERSASLARKFIGVDGSMVVLPELPAPV
ncbi:MAG: hypothetical protein HKN64_01040 [Woeseiaceae bacterium]|nr:hypothetical protein [Woeseiaceae bacterium]